MAINAQRLPTILGLYHRNSNFPPDKPGEKCLRQFNLFQQQCVKKKFAKPMKISRENI